MIFDNRRMLSEDDRRDSSKAAMRYVARLGNEMGRVGYPVCCVSGMAYHFAMGASAPSLR